MQSSLQKGSGVVLPHSMGPGSLEELNLHISFGVLRVCCNFRCLQPEGRSVIMSVSPPVIAI